MDNIMFYHKFLDKDGNVNIKRKMLSYCLYCDYACIDKPFIFLKHINTRIHSNEILKKFKNNYNIDKIDIVYMFLLNGISFSFDKINWYKIEKVTDFIKYVEIIFRNYF